MEQYRTVRELRAALEHVRARGQSVGMVGTSGAMHQGHLSLIERSVADNDLTAMFWGGAGSHDWMASQITYARDAGRDLALAEAAGLDAIFAPYDHELFAREPMTTVSLPAMSSGVPHLEDPAHLDLIAMVMGKLWNMFGPCRSYFGEKDWQQLVMFQRLADDLAWPVDVIGCPTVREDDGLAVSSRNAQLSPEQRAVAPVLYRALEDCRDAALAGPRTAAELEKVFAATIGTVGDPGCIRYFTAVEAGTMVPLDELAGSVRLLGSIELGSVRLLDNLGIDLPASPEGGET
jgi:pantoate--beta-alanine ligase